MGATTVGPAETAPQLLGWGQQCIDPKTSWSQFSQIKKFHSKQSQECSIYHLTPHSKRGRPLHPTPSPVLGPKPWSPSTFQPWLRPWLYVYCGYIYCQLLLHKSKKWCCLYDLQRLNFQQNATFAFHEGVQRLLGEVNTFTLFCAKQIRGTVYQILSEQVKFCRRQQKQLARLTCFQGHSVHVQPTYKLNSSRLTEHCTCLLYLCGPSNNFIIQATSKILMMMMMMMMMMYIALIQFAVFNKSLCYNPVLT